MSDNGNTQKPPNSKDPLDLLAAAIQAAALGNREIYLTAHYPGPDGEDLGPALQTCLQAIAGRTAQYHDSAMDLALGLSDCIGALAAYRAGTPDAAVSEATTSSSEPMVAKLGVSLNETLAEVQTQISLIGHQRAAIRELATPVLRIWDGVLALPVIGLVDTRRSADILERMLSEITSQQCRFVILDITGVDIVDTRTADYFVKMIQAAELLGTRCFLSGIQPGVAQTLVELGVNLSALDTRRNLQGALRACLREQEAAPV